MFAWETIQPLPRREMPVDRHDGAGASAPFQLGRELYIRDMDGEGVVLSPFSMSALIWASDGSVIRDGA